jgi:hypothetical protein
VQRRQRGGEGGLGLRAGALIIRVHHASRARASHSGSPGSAATCAGLIPNPGVYLEYETITHNPTPVG